MNTRTVYDEKPTTILRTKYLCSKNDATNKKTVGNDKMSPEKRSRTASESSIEAYVHHSDSEESLLEEHEAIGDAVGPADVVEQLSHLEQKMDRLSDLFLEQCRIMSAIKGEIQNSRDVIEKSQNVYSQRHPRTTNDNITHPANGWEEINDVYCAEDGAPTKSRARTLLDAIEAKTAPHVRGPREASDTLAGFLQSDELMERMVVATSASAREVVGACVSREVAARYVPALHRAQRRLARHMTRAVDDAFMELEERSAQTARHVQRASRQLRRALDRHQCAAPTHDVIHALKNTVQTILDIEMKQWRQKMLETITSAIPANNECLPESSTPSPDNQQACSPVSPSNSTNPEHLMQMQVRQQAECAELAQAFWRALSAGRLARVVAQCRAAPPALVARALPVPALLALLQQLATDMLHDTPLQCGYLEEVIISLNPSDPQTRTHLPLVVGEMRKHLLNFLASYPNHVASRRIKMIIMAAENLLKYCA